MGKFKKKIDQGKEWTQNKAQQLRNSFSPDTSNSPEMSNIPAESADGKTTVAVRASNLEEKVLFWEEQRKLNEYLVPFVIGLQEKSNEQERKNAKFNKNLQQVYFKSLEQSRKIAINATNGRLKEVLVELEKARDRIDHMEKRIKINRRLAIIAFTVSIMVTIALIVQIL